MSSQAKSHQEKQLQAAMRRSSETIGTIAAALAKAEGAFCSPAMVRPNGADQGLFRIDQLGLRAMPRSPAGSTLYARR